MRTRTRVGVLVAGALLATLALGWAQPAFADVPVGPSPAKDLADAQRKAAEKAGVATAAAVTAPAPASGFEVHAAAFASDQTNLIVAAAVVVTVVVVLSFLLLLKLRRSTGAEKAGGPEGE